MSTAYVSVTIVAAAAVLFSSGIDIFRAQWVRDNMKLYSIPEWTLFPLAIIKIAGALGLLVGLAYRPLALAAAVCLVLYFVAALATLLRAGYFAHISYPLPYLALSAASLALLPLA